MGVKAPARLRRRARDSLPNAGREAPHRGTVVGLADRSDEAVATRPPPAEGGLIEAPRDLDEAARGVRDEGAFRLTASVHDIRSPSASRHHPRCTIDRDRRTHRERAVCVGAGNRRLGAPTAEVVSSRIGRSEELIPFGSFLPVRYGEGDPADYREEHALGVSGTDRE